MERRMPCEDGEGDLGLSGCKATDKCCKVLSVATRFQGSMPGPADTLISDTGPPEPLL